jgi:hypothetical protein
MTMNKSLVPAKPIEMPEEFQRFFDLPEMVGDEKLSDYYDLHSAIANAVRPTDIFDWIWVEDFVRTERDIRRDRRTKDHTIKLTEKELVAELECEVMMNRLRREAIRAQRLAAAEADSPGKALKNKKDATPEVAKPEAPKIEDPHLQAKVFIRRGNELDRIDERISGNQKKRDGILWGIYRRRESLAQRKSSPDIIDGEFTEAPE